MGIEGEPEIKRFFIDFATTDQVFSTVAYENLHFVLT